MRDDVPPPMTGPANFANSLGKIEGAKREKTWDECGIEEKVERLRRVMRDERGIAEGALKIAHNANDLAHGHQHNQSTGEVLRSVNRHGGMTAAEGYGRRFDPLA